MSHAAALHTTGVVDDGLAQVVSLPAKGTDSDVVTDVQSGELLTRREEPIVTRKVRWAPRVTLCALGLMYSPFDRNCGATTVSYRSATFVT